MTLQVVIGAGVDGLHLGRSEGDLLTQVRARRHDEVDAAAVALRFDGHHHLPLREARDVELHVGRPRCTGGRAARVDGDVDRGGLEGENDDGAGRGVCTSMLCIVSLPCARSASVARVAMVDLGRERLINEALKSSRRRAVLARSSPDRLYHLH